MSWQADIAALDFGLVACGFSHECTFTLRNTSAVPARYAWRALGASSPAASQAELQAGPVLHYHGKDCLSMGRLPPGCIVNDVTMVLAWGAYQQDASPVTRRPLLAKNATLSRGNAGSRAPQLVPEPLCWTWLRCDHAKAAEKPVNLIATMRPGSNIPSKSLAIKFP